MANKHILGQNIQLWVDGKTIAFAKSATFNVSVEEIDVSTKDEGGYSAFDAGLINWDMSSDNLIGDPRCGMGFDELMDIVLKKEPVDVIYGLKDTVTGRAEKYLAVKPEGWDVPTKGSHYKGKAIITSLSQTSPNGEVATMSVTLKGRSPLEKVDATSTEGTVSTMSLPKSSSAKA